MSTQHDIFHSNAPFSALPLDLDYISQINQKWYCFTLFLVSDNLVAIQINDDKIW